MPSPRLPAAALRRPPAYFSVNTGRSHMQAPVPKSFVRAPVKASVWRKPLPEQNNSDLQQTAEPPPSFLTALTEKKHGPPLTEPCALSSDAMQWCHQTLLALKTPDLKIWWLRLFYPSCRASRRPKLSHNQRKGLLSAI